MGYNYARERSRMEREFAEIAEQFRTAGFLEEEIEDIIHRIMLDELNGDRRFYTHTQSLDGFAFSDGDEADESRSPLFEKYMKQLSVCLCETGEGERLGWIEDINNPQLAEWLNTLPRKDIELLTLLYEEDLPQKQIAELCGCSEAAISKRKSRLLKNAKKFLSKG